MDKNKKPPPEKDAWGRDYLGNIWGWKFSFLGLFLLLFLLGIMAYRYFILELPIHESAKEKIEQVD